MQIVWVEETRDDFRRLDEFLDPINSDAAVRAAAAIREKTQILIDNPKAG